MSALKRIRIPNWSPDWGVIRIFGELQILTRASYVMLIVVPLLAGVWPTVRMVINGHNKVINEATTQLSSVAHDLSLRAGKLSNDASAIEVIVQEDSRRIAEFTSHIQELSRIVEEELTKLRRHATLSPWLPSSLAVS
jgi:hypothetical protein